MSAEGVASVVYAYRSIFDFVGKYSTGKDIPGACSYQREDRTMKMTTVFTCWWVVVFLAIMAMVSQSRKVRSDTTPLNKRQTIALHHAVKKLLGFRDLPHKMEEGSAGFGVPRPLHVKSNSLSPPQYMLDLYQRYRYSAISNGKQTGNTVRCINADIGEYLVYNLDNSSAVSIYHVLQLKLPTSDLGRVPCG